MYLVHPKKAQEGKWEVAWMWLPHFLAQDRSLHRHVAEEMTTRFGGQVLEDDRTQKNQVLMEMHNEVIRLILERYPIPGLRAYLESTIHLDPETQEET